MHLSKRSFLSTLALTLLALPILQANPTFQPTTCEGSYPRHVQGICTNGKDAICWSWTDALVKTDNNGRILKQVPADNHQGDLCHHNGRVYVATNLGKFNRPAGEANSWVYVYDENTLELLAKHPVPELVHGAGGMEYHQGKFYIIGGLPPGTDENYVYEYDQNFHFQKRHVINSGYTLMGIQTITYAEGSWWFGCYGKPTILLRTDENFNLTGKWQFNAAVGIAPIGNQKFLIAQNTTIQSDDKKNKLNQAKTVIARIDEKSGLTIENP